MSFADGEDGETMKGMVTYRKTAVEKRPKMLIKLLLAGIFLLGAMVLPGAVVAQQAPNPSATVMTFPSSSSLVVVDVVVTGKHGESLTGLTSSDFSVLEDGKSQVIKQFQYVNTSNPGHGTRTPGIPVLQNVYTNRPAYSVHPAEMIVLLLDGLNTDSPDQSYARAQMLKYLSTQLRPNQKIAVYALGHTLNVLQKFTDDPDVLRTAVDGFVPQESREMQVGDIEKLLPPPSRNGQRRGDAG